MSEEKEETWSVAKLTIDMDELAVRLIEILTGAERPGDKTAHELIEDVPEPMANAVHAMAQAAVHYIVGCMKNDLVSPNFNIITEDEIH